MKLRNAILALGFAIAFTFGSFALNANIDAPTGIIGDIVIDATSNDMAFGILIDETARVTISTEDGTVVYSNEFTTSQTVSVGTRGWDRGTYIIVLVEEDGSVATAAMDI